MYNIYLLPFNRFVNVNPLQTIISAKVNNSLKEFYFSNIISPAIVFNNFFYVLKEGEVVFNADKTAGFLLNKIGTIEFYEQAQK